MRLGCWLCWVACGGAFVTAGVEAGCGMWSGRPIPRQSAGAVPVEDYAAAFVEGYADRPDTAVQAVTGQSRSCSSVSFGGSAVISAD